MSYEPPTLTTEIVNTLNESTLEQLREIATYAEALAEHKEREARLEESASASAYVAISRSCSGVDSLSVLTISVGSFAGGVGGS